MLSKALVVGAYQRKCEELAQLPGVELTVVVPPYWQEAGRRIELEHRYTAGYELIVEPMRFNGHFHVHYYPGLARQVCRRQPDILHIDEEPYNLASFQALRLGQQVGARCLFFTWQNLYRRYAFPFSWLESYVLRHAAYAIAGNAEAVTVLRRKGYAGPVTVIPQFGVDPAIYSPMNSYQQQESCLLPPASFTIGYVGRLVEEKGLFVLLRAVVRLTGDWRLVLIGSGPLQPQIERLAASLGIVGRLTFIPGVPSSEMPRYLSQFSVLVLPSLTQPNWKEQFGRVLVEAMSCQVPVIGSDCGEIPQVIGEAGLIVPEGDGEALRQALARLQADADLRQRLGELGRARVLAHYTQARIAQETYQVYHEMCHPHPITLSLEGRGPG
jgi:glycosyltransferase involved in cell wall biosynthesis